MMLFNQVLEALKTKKSFTLYPYQIGPYKPEGRIVHQLSEVDVGHIGYIMQWWARLSIYSPRTLSFNWANDRLQIIYDANTNTETDKGNGPDTLSPIAEGEGTSEGGGGNN